MANPEHLAILRQGVDVWNEWNTKYHPNKVKPDLSGANLAHENLRDIILSDVDLSNADLSEASLINATLVRTNFTRANLVKTELDGADFHQATLWQANLKGAFLSGSSFNYTDLEEANFTYATVDQTVFGDVDLRNVKGLKSIRHQGPSLISTTALVRSGGNIPEVFLRKAGVPDSIIEYSHSLLTNPIEYYSCFISYSSKDQDFADRLYADLQDKGVRCWFAPHDLKIGDRFADRIEQSIRIYDKLLIILSKNSVRSIWVEDECRAAMEKESRFREEQQLDKTVLFPIKIDEAIRDATSQWVCKIRRERHIGDFTNWKDHDEYQKAFKRLIRDLKA